MRSKQSTTSGNFSVRILVVTILFTISFLAISAKAIYLQVYEGSWLSTKAKKEYKKSFLKSGRRGSIYDRNFSELAVSVDISSIGVCPNQVDNKKEVSKKLAKILGLNCRQVERKLNQKKSFVWVKRHVTPKEASNVAALNIPAIDFIPENSRFYPNRTLAAQVLGFSGLDGRGLEGVEFYYDRFLRGEKIQFNIVRDALGRGFEEKKKVLHSYNGKNLVLTIDRTIQFVSEKAVEEAVKEYSAKSGLAVVMVPQTGEILAMAHYPFFNPNSFADFEHSTWRNRAIADQFEPGSTMKVFLAAAALNSGYCTKNSIFFCENGSYRIGRNTIHDTHEYSWLSLKQIIKFSSNIGASKISETIGKRIFFDSLIQFGFNARSGIDCPGETSGMLSSYKKWTKIDASAIAFGQGVSVSAIQLVSAVSAIANGGNLMKPYLVKTITDRKNRVYKQFTPKKVRRVLISPVARTILNIMESVTTPEGTGTNAILDGYSVGGKTGTAQKVSRKGGYAKGKYIASFVGITPISDPRLVILVLVDEPQKAHYGGTVAAPVFKKIAEAALSYLKVEPDLESKKMSVSNETGVKG